jgi:membrane protease YdiL (CAAX protease family)
MTDRKRSVLSFFVLAFIWSWGLNAPRVAATAGYLKLPDLVSTIMGWLAVAGPMVAAFWLLRRRQGQGAIRSLWRSAWRWRFDKRWWWAIALLMPAHALLTAGVLLALGRTIPWEYGLPPAMTVPIFILIYLINALPEELGWRGYALPRLQERFSPLVSGLILGAVWALWHLPLHFIEGTTQWNLPIWQYAAQTLVLSVLYVWIFNGTQGSVAAAVGFHAISNFSAAVVPTWTTNTGRLVGFGLLTAIAAVVIATGGLKGPGVVPQRPAGLPDVGPSEEVRA